ncbi:MAG TPA: DUF2306 domain-containing protein [Acidobacteriaceae bacterium]|nr:DUF2306 domain-containing protein [Acidobacteriaceae bacterium]
MPVKTSAPPPSIPKPASALIWTPFLLLCLIAAAAAIRRMVVLALPPNPAPASPNAILDAVFAARKGLTLAHIIPALGFVALLPFWFAQRMRTRLAVHRRITLGLFVLGTVVGLTAIPMSARPVGGITEQSAALLYDGLFLFFLARAFVAFRAQQSATHRIWMMRAIAVLLGIATTRPVMGVFFATQRLTHLRVDQFFGIAFWIGFTTTYLAGEIYLRRVSHSSPPLA